MKWTPSAGEDRYRRSLYTFSKRTAPFNAYLIFDAPTGENCIARRDNSNTPLQALTLLNDEMFLELARSLAKKALKPKLNTSEARATFIFRRFLTRPPTKRELETLLKFFQSQKTRIENNELDPAIICKDKQASPELAVWVLLARAVMNLDETIVKQ